MKKIFLLSLFSFLIASTFSVEGMTCGMGCVNKIMSEIETLDGVKSCDVNFDKGTLKVDYDSSILNDDKIKSHLEVNTIYKVALLSEKTIEKASCSKSCSTSCCSKKEKVGFFKKIFSWF